MDRLDWNLLRTYLTIMQERSISRAAARLHLTQPAVSQALKRLEDSLGRTLIQRRGAQFQPTRAGEEVYRIATDIYGHMSRLDNELDDRGGELIGSVRLLCVSRVESPVYDEFLAEFRRTYPRVDLHVEVMRSADILSSLLQKPRLADSHYAERRSIKSNYAVFCDNATQCFADVTTGYSAARR